MCRKWIYLTCLLVLLGQPQASVTNAADGSLVGWWKLDETSGIVAHDSSGYGNDGILYGDPQWGGGALEFDGDGDYVDCGDGPSLNIAGSVTITGWIRLDGPADDRKIAGNQDGITGGYKFGVYGNRVEFEIRTADNVPVLNRSVAGGVVLEPGMYHHVAGVYSEGEYIRTYVDGVLDRELSTAEFLGTSTATFKLGREPFSDSYFWLGLMDDVRVYNRALTQAEIQDIGFGLQGEVSLLAWSRTAEDDEALIRSLDIASSIAGLPVTLELVPYAEYPTILSDRLATGVPPDLLWVDQEMLPELADMALLADIGGPVAEFPELTVGLSAEELEIYEFDGTLLAIPYPAPGGSPQFAISIAATSPFSIVSLADIIKNLKFYPAWRNPGLNTCAVAHGESSEMDYAHAFLTGIGADGKKVPWGTDSSGNPVYKNLNHCPSTWTRTHIHVQSPSSKPTYPLTSLSKTANYYYDPDLSTAGLDSNVTQGVDTRMLFFYVGHCCSSPGGPWQANDGCSSTAAVKYMNLGDWAGFGFARYYWQASCWVFAHGPATCTSTATPAGYPALPTYGATYRCPWEKKTAGVLYNSIYDTWGPALGPDIRMVCGSSTKCIYGPHNGSMLWSLLNNSSYMPAKAWIYGLTFGEAASKAQAKAWWTKPICLALGNATDSPLSDKKFTNQPNGFGNSHYHLMYGRILNNSFTYQMGTPTASPYGIPFDAMPVFELVPMELPATVDPNDLYEEDGFFVSRTTVDGEIPEIKVAPASGAVYFAGEERPYAAILPSDDAYCERALDFVYAQDWAVEASRDATGERFVVEIRPVNGSDEETESFQDGTIVAFNRVVDVEGHWIDVFGEGGRITVLMNNDGSVVRGSKVWRQIVGVRDWVPVKPLDQAIEEAREQFEDADEYDLTSWSWGYTEDAGNVEQNEMRIAYWLYFDPIEEGSAKLSRVVTILGQVEFF